jgi:lysozyme family protein
MNEQDRFNRCLPLALAHEGGFVDDARDPGGITNLGVTKAAWEAWIGRPATLGDMRALTPAVVSPFYDQRYWLAAMCDDLPAGLDYITFDAAVNHGPGRAKMFLQKALGVSADGQIGPVTMLALRGCDIPTTIRQYAHLREAFYRALPDFDHFGDGWIRRLGEVTAQSLFWAGIAATSAPKTLADAKALHQP